MKAPRKLLHYVRKHIAVLWAAVGLSALLGVLESLRTVLIGYVFIAFFGELHNVDAQRGDERYEYVSVE